MKRYWKFTLVLFLLCLVLAPTVLADSENEDLSSFILPNEGFTFQVDSSYLGELQLSESELSTDTRALLDTVLQSKYFGQYMYAQSQPYENVISDFSDFNGFCELVAREDFEKVFAQYMEGYLTQANDTALDERYMLIALEMLRSPAVYEKLSDETMLLGAGILKNDKALTSSAFQPLEIESMPSFSINGIDYYLQSSVTTVGGLSVSTYYPERELTSAEITECNSQLDMSGNTRLYSPTTKYNCHSYAWHEMVISNTSWIIDIAPYISDSNTTAKTFSTAQVNDIVVYVDANGSPVHSGVVYSISDSTIRVISKWGQGAVYIHDITQVPSSYYSGVGEVTVYFFTYHNYVYQYTGEQYHSGAYHYDEYAYICSICKHKKDSEWVKRVCDGPPCAIINPVTIYLDEE